MKGIRLVRTIQENNTPRSIVRLAQKDDMLWVVKDAPKHNLDNEVYALKKLNKSKYVPQKWHRQSHESLYIAYCESDPITDRNAFMWHYYKVMDALHSAKLRHGDLTEYSVIPSGNRPILVDWAESRIMADPRPDKRPEGDGHWLWKTMEKLCQTK